MNSLDDPKVQAVLTREHERAEDDTQKLAGQRAKIDAAKKDGTFSYSLYPTDVYLSIEPAMGIFLNLNARSCSANRRCRSA